jgi:hypothetical protein
MNEEWLASEIEKFEKEKAMSEIQTGEGYRLIDKAKDTKRPGDEYWSCFGDWALASNDGMFHPEHVYRRRIPAKPEAMEIWNAFKVQCGYAPDHFAIWQVGPPDSAGDVVIGNAAEARQLADWLTRFAEWREAQGDNNERTN